MKRIVMVIGGVETLEYFSYEMGKEFVRRGYDVFYFDLKNAAASGKKLRKFIKTGETALVTFNFEGLEKEEGVYRQREGYVWDEFQVPCYNIAADHPYYYEDRLKELPKRYYHISIDKKQEAYFKEFYPEYESLGFLPLAGTRPLEQNDNSSMNSSGENVYHENCMIEKHKVEAMDKTIDVIMTGNYTPPSFCDSYIHAINEEYAAFYQGIIDDLISHPTRTVEEVALEHCQREMGENTIQDLRLALHKMVFIDLYVRNYWRGKAVADLVDEGIKVDVFGKGWEELSCIHPENLIIHPQTTSQECLRQIQKAKISLNVMPLFKDGAHDRVFNSILNGTVCVSDESKYLCEELPDGEGVCYFSLEQICTLSQKVKDLLSDEACREHLLAKGKPIVEEKHTWANRAQVIEKWILENES